MNKEIKVVLLGESGVGKSSICLRFCQNDFKVTNEPTLGAAFMSRIIECKGIMFKFQIWDTAGQEKYKSLTPLYYRDAQVAIIVYDITNKESFATLKTWVDELKEHGPKKLIQVLVGNKTDLIEQEQIQYDEAQRYSQQIGATLKLTSCKSNEGITEMFNGIAEQLLQQEQDNLANQANKKTQKEQQPQQPQQLTSQNNNSNNSGGGGCC